ncbi:unnamed protein product [Rotaria magnacalcarata]|uniref:Uncharacterized protein n=1 Tax=Rotaria magnacalcarata TaxID=392030 RepID=A0A816NPV7_9BILA|nr:unnamed protein product [Rotaria magnacalcarata]CAF5219327.1 unnamed protein product [Rotaria magnacalcarata]
MAKRPCTTQVDRPGVANYLQAINNVTIFQQNFNSSNFKKLDVKACVHLIQALFLPNKDVEYITWTQLSIFVAVFQRLFTDFSQCGYFLVDYVQESTRRLDIVQLRVELVQILLKSSNQFTSLSVESVLKRQRSAANAQSDKK